QDGHLRFDVDRGEWAFDLPRIESMAITDNVVDLVISRLRRLPTETQHALSVAAFVGNEFNQRIPAMAAGSDARSFGALLRPAVQEGFLVPLGEDYPWMNHVEGGSPEARFRFVHDRAQQAAYALVPAAECAARHLQLGRLLLEHLSADERKDHMFE